MSKRSQSSSPRVAKKRHARKPSHADEYPAKATLTWNTIGHCAAAMGIYVMAIKAYEASLVHSPGSLESLLGWSSAVRSNDLASGESAGVQTALERLTRAADSFPALTHSADFFKELTECYLLVDLNEQAHQSVLQAIQLSPTDASLFLLQAQTLIRVGQRHQAAATLSHCLQLLPPAIVNFSQADIETARSAHAELAAIAAAEGDIESSIRELTATLSLPPPSLARVGEHVALWCALATAKERANRIPEALAACESAEVAVGPSPRILITHAYLLLLSESTEHAERAVAMLSRVVDSEPQDEKPKSDDEASDDQNGDFLPWFLLGKAYTVLGQPRAAYDSYQIALRRASSLPITWLAVGKLYLELKQLPDALAAYSQALRLQLNENSPGTAAAWDGLCCVYERCDDQLGDAADACSRAAACFRAYGDAASADNYEAKAKHLQDAASGSVAVPEPSEPYGVPNYFLRDLVTLLPSERIAFVQGAASSRVKPEGDPSETARPPVAEKQPYEASAYRPDEKHDHAQQAQAPQAPPPPQSQSQRPSAPSLPSAPQYVHAAPPHPGMPPQPVYMYGYKPDDKSLPGPPQSQMWQGPEQMPGQPPHMMRGPPPMSAHYGPPPNGMMSPPAGPQGSPNGPLRSPAPHPSVPEGYPVPGPPGYMYGQYVPMHGNMMPQAQPYGGTWRR